MNAKAISVVMAFVIASTTVNTRSEELSIDKEKDFSVTIGADVVCTYVWRGSFLDGA